MILPELIEKVENTSPKFSPDVRKYLADLRYQCPDMPDQMLMDLGKELTRLQTEFLERFSHKSEEEKMDYALKFTDKVTIFLRHLSSKYEYPRPAKKAPQKF